MRKFSYVSFVRGPLVALFVAGCAGAGVSPLGPSTTQADASKFVPAGPDWIYADGALFHRPHYAATRSMALSPASRISPLLPYVPYLGGPVIVAPKFYFTFWDFNKKSDPDKIEPLVLEYAKVMGGSDHNNIEVQYYQGTKKQKTYITNPSKQFGGSWNDNSAVPKKPSDAQIAAESLKAVGHFGYDPNGVYLVVTPHKHSEVDFGSKWCAYHSSAYYQKNPIPYAYLPYIPDAGSNCGSDIVTPPSDESGKNEGVTIMAGHEFGETITDPQPFTAWTGPAGEIADVCAFQHIANDPFGKKSYTMQPMVSDATRTCVQSYSPSR
ncbi:MAG: hypothetical protein WB810_11825 [Candidatus Cybelea sp.]